MPIEIILICERKGCGKEVKWKKDIGKTIHLDFGSGEDGFYSHVTAVNFATTDYVFLCSDCHEKIMNIKSKSEEEINKFLEEG